MNFLGRSDKASNSINGELRFAVGFSRRSSSYVAGMWSSTTTRHEGTKNKLLFRETIFGFNLKLFGF